VKQKRFKRSFAQLLVAVGATMFLATPVPASASMGTFDACSQCHSNLTFAECAGIVNYTISSCCGSGGGWAWCVNSEWGFYVDCNSTMGTGECQCDMWGNNCDPNFRTMEGG
jgi:hypothetical protein